MVKSKVEEFLQISGLPFYGEKISITHARTGNVFFLGTHIFKTRLSSLTANLVGNSRCTDHAKVCLEAPVLRLASELTALGFFRGGRSWPKFSWRHYPLAQIIAFYNAVIRGYLDYYSFVDNRAALVSLIYRILRGSCAKLIAAKMKLGSRLKVFAKYGKNLAVGSGKATFRQKPSAVSTPWSFRSGCFDSAVGSYVRANSLADSTDFGRKKCVIGKAMPGRISYGQYVVKPKV